MDFAPHSSLTEFFHEAVTAAARNQGLRPSEHTEFYLVNLLAGFARTPVDHEPLALQMAEATFASSEERAQKLREVGDRSLYVSGFFSDSLNRRLVDVEYYIRMGGNAYGQLALMPVSRAPRGDVFRELARDFSRFVDVLSEVSEWSALASDHGMLQLYERWRRTGADWMERRLRAMGMLPVSRELQ